MSKVYYIEDLRTGTLSIHRVSDDKYLGETSKEAIK